MVTSSLPSHSVQRETGLDEGPGLQQGAGLVSHGTLHVDILWLVEDVPNLVLDLELEVQWDGQPGLPTGLHANVHIGLLGAAQVGNLQLRGRHLRLVVAEVVVVRHPVAC